MENIQYSIPSNIEQVFADFKGRRVGLIKALTTDVDKFYQQCNPEHENLSLYGHPNESWEVNLPIEEVPTELPEPVLGINFARDGMKKKDWLSLIAVHCDSWLISVAMYHGARLGFGKNERAKLFNVMSDLPTVNEVLTKSFEQPKEKISAQQKSSKKRSRNESSQEPEPLGKVVPGHVGEDNVDEDDDETAICGTCGSNDTDIDEFWIMCDSCERWFHGKCVKVTPAKAKHIKEYKCPDC